MKKPSNQIVFVTVALALSACASAPQKPDVPVAIRVSQNQTVSSVFSAKGVQIYECSLDPSNPGHYAWTFKAPRADLLDSGGKIVGHHFAGPTWESDDHSSIVGRLKASDPGPDTSAIPWLLLDGNPNGGAGVFSAVTAIQRLYTVGGQPGPNGCDSAHASYRIEVPYSAQYYFYQGRP